MNIDITFKANWKKDNATFFFTPTLAYTTTACNRYIYIAFTFFCIELEWSKNIKKDDRDN